MKQLKFNDEFIPMIKDGVKTVTRRPIKPQPEGPFLDKGGAQFWEWNGKQCYFSVEVLPFCPCGIPGTIHEIEPGLKIKITNVRVERVQGMSENCAYLEGVSPEPHEDNLDAFVNSWDSIYEEKGFGWDKNPWVWVIEFERCE